MVVGFSVSMLLQMFLSERLFNSILSPAIPFSQREIGDLDIATTTAVLFAVCIAWFFGTMLFYRFEDREYVAQMDRFFYEMNTPIAASPEDSGSYETDSRQYRVLGNLCLIYSDFILLLLLIPNPVKAKLWILFCGSFLVVPGIVLRVLGRLVSNRGREGHPQRVAEYVPPDHQHEGGSA
jgi:hypothetical protein